MRAPERPPIRPAVSVIVPFAGSQAEARAMVTNLLSLELGEGDEVIIVDNQPGGAVSIADAPQVRVVRDERESSSYYARNVGVENSTADWILFIDSDCRPRERLLDAYFEQPISDRCGIVAGAVRSAPEQSSTAASYARSRGHVNERFHVESGEKMAAGPTANLLVRRAAWKQLGGFHEGVRSGADVEFCFRAQKAGWELDHRPAAVIEHWHPDSVRRMLRKARRYGAGRLWVERRFPGESPRQRLTRPLGRCAAGVLVWTLALQPRRALYKLLDACWIVSLAGGWWCGDNRSRRPMDGMGTIFLLDEFPLHGDTDPGPSSRVEARSRPPVPDREASRRLNPAYREDDPPAERLAALAWLWARHPFRIARIACVRRRPESLSELAPALRRIIRNGSAEVRGGPGYLTMAGLLSR